MLKYFKLGDLLIIFCLGLMSLALAIFLGGRAISQSNEVFIESGKKLVGRYSLINDRCVTVSGPLGETKVKIEGGSVSIISSPCRNHYCVKMGKAQSAGMVLVCAPNEIIVRVGGNESTELDAISR